MPLTGGVLSLVAAVGPLSAENVTAYSQSTRANTTIPSGEPTLKQAEPTRPETVAFARLDIIRTGTVTIINDFAFDFAREKSHTIRSSSTISGSPTSVTLSLKGQFLDVEGETWTTRFDLSPLLTRDSRSLADLHSTLHSVEGRKSEFILSRVQRVPEPAGPAVGSLGGTIIVH